MRCLLPGLIPLLTVSIGLAQQDSVTHQIIFIGDAGTSKVRELAPLIQQHVRTGTVPTSFVFLGDNIYPRGLPDRGSKDRKKSEQILLDQVSLTKGANDVFFIPGNHDWKNGHHDGLRYRSNQQAFLDSLKNKSLHFLPKDGCPGPEEIHLGNDLVLVLIDTEWFLYPWTKPEGDESPCESKTAVDAAIALDDILNRNQGKRVIVSAHHPVYTYGEHGGVFKLRDHLFPLTGAQKNLYIPLPIIGSLLPVYRKMFGNIQDIAHPLNKTLRRSLEDVMLEYPGTIYASGHEHAQQYIVKDSIHYIGSGAGSKSTPVKKKGFSLFASSEQGFAKLLVLKDGRAHVEFYSLQGKLYSASIRAPRQEKLSLARGGMNDTLWVLTNASYRYEAGKFRRRLLGENYRAEWAEKIELSAFDIGREKGGLKVIRKGGGAETMALRLRDSSGHEYNLRSIEKYPSQGLPPAFRNTFIQAVKQDQVSASHPYAALVVAPLEEKAGIFHTNPRVTYAPSDLRWGVYRRDFEGKPMLFEERPDGDGADMPFFGNPHRIISTRRLLERMHEDNDVQVDQKLALRARLFDMWTGDWDRHDDQWRWGEFDQKKVKLFKPIPRDRDHAFFVNQGFAPHRWRRRHIFPNLEGFDYDIRWAPGIMLAGRYFDRSFLNEMTESDFAAAAKDLAAHMTDNVIDSAMHAWPESIRKFHGDIIASKLMARRAVLMKNARVYYKFLAKQVDVVGSNKREWIDAEWLPGGNLEVKMFKRDKDGNKGRLLYERRFINGETKELRFYGLGGDDMFHFSGPANAAMKTRLVGGEGSDEVNNEASGASRIFVYDNKNGIVFEGNKVRNHTSDDPNINDYDRKAYEYNKIAPKNTIIYNIDDGIFVGTGFSTIVHGFRKKPYQSHHMLQGSYAIKTQSFNIRYEGRFPRLIGKWDLELDADVKSPNYVNNFFGWGNESVFDQNINTTASVDVASPIDYYRLRFRDIRAEVKIHRRIGQWGYFKVGPVFQRGQVVDPNTARFIKDYSATLPEPILGVSKDFGGIAFTWGIDRRDNPGYTTRGIVFRQSSRIMNEFGGSGFTFNTATFTLYQSFRLPARVTYVFNAGAGHNTGSYQLYQAQALDGKTEIRGFRKTRFYGDTKLYFNNEVRVKLATLHTYLFPAALGVHAFYDVGRVWYHNENGIDPSAPNGTSDKWHKGYGGGVWFRPYDLTTIVTEVGSSEEGTLFYLRLGFLF